MRLVLSVWHAISINFSYFGFSVSRRQIPNTVFLLRERQLSSALPIRRGCRQVPCWAQGCRRNGCKADQAKSEHIPSPFATVWSRHCPHRAGNVLVTLSLQGHRHPQPVEVPGSQRVIFVLQTTNPFLSTPQTCHWTLFLHFMVGLTDSEWCVIVLANMLVWKYKRKQIWTAEKGNVAVSSSVDWWQCP